MSIVHSARCHSTTLLLIPWQCSPWCPGDEGHFVWLFDLEMLGSWSLNSRECRGCQKFSNKPSFGIFEWKSPVSYGCIDKTCQFLQKFINLLKFDKMRSFSNYPIGIALSTHFLGLITWESSFCLSCFWLLHALRGNTSAGNCFFFPVKYFFISCIRLLSKIAKF